MSLRMRSTAGGRVLASLATAKRRFWIVLFSFCTGAMLVGTATVGGARGTELRRGHVIVFTCGPAFNTNLCRLDTATGRVTQLTHDADQANVTYRSPSLAADGHRIAFVYARRPYVSDLSMDTRRLLIDDDSVDRVQ